MLHHNANVMFIEITELNIDENDNSTYFSVTSMDAMYGPDESIKFDRNSNYKYGQWFQVRIPDSGVQKPSKTPGTFLVYIWNSDKGVSISCDFRIFNFKSKYITQCGNRMPARCTSKFEFIKLFLCSLNISFLFLNSQLKTMKSDFTYKVWRSDFTYDDLQSFIDDKLKATNFCEKRGLSYDQTRQPSDYFTCISTLEGS